MDELLRDFLTETGESLDVVDAELVRFEQNPNDAKILGNIFRLVHTIKGTCGFLALPRLEALTHAAEALMGNFRDGAPVTGEAVSLILATLDRIKQVLDELERHHAEMPGDDRDLIDRLERMSVQAADRTGGGRTIGTMEPQAIGRPPHPGQAPVGDLEHAFLELPNPDDEPAEPEQDESASNAPGRQEGREHRSSHPQVARQSIRVHVDTLERLMTLVSELVLTRNQLVEIGRRNDDSEFKGPLQRLANITAELQEGVLKTRMQPIGNVWQKLPRIVRDLSAELGKTVDFEMYGADTELDRQVLDFIRDPLTHMVRNSADHGLESPPERRAAGKPERGLIRLSARHEGGHILIEACDDGRGLDTARIKANAIAKGLATEAEIANLSETQIQKFIFMPGISTADRITTISGRGIGMDVVRNNVDRIGGTIDVRSTPGQGTSFQIKIPLTLAIVPALIVDVAGTRFAIPQIAVVELVRVRSNSDHRIECIKDAPVLRLRDKLLPLVDLSKLLGFNRAAEPDRCFIVVTQVGRQAYGIMVDAVLSTEEIVVKPMSSKLRHIGVFSGNTILGDGSVILIVDPNGVAQASAIEAPRAATEAAPNSSGQSPETPLESLLVFRAGSPQPKAVPLSLVTRLEIIDAATIEMSGGRALLQYRGQLLPLVPAAESVAIKTAGRQPLVVFVGGGRSMALLVDEIVDIVEARLEIEPAGARPGVIGTAVVKEQATEIIDLAHFLPMAYEDWVGWKDRPESKTTRHHVLLIDDAAFFRNMLAPVLKAAGYAVTPVGSALEALDLLRSGQRFHVIVADMEMPGMDGFKLAAAAHGYPGAAEVPIIGLSTMVSTDTIERGRRAGLNDYVAKFDRQGLIVALKQQTAEFEFAA
ncbi:MAG: chemotaxis protein CheW [Xanthobacteraceae bacterium]